MTERLVCARINLTNYAQNFKNVKTLLSPGTQILAVCKANAYGHGMVAIAKEAEKLGATYIGVVCLYEARVLREAGIQLPILLMNYTDADSIEQAVDLDVTLTVMDSAVLTLVDRYARKSNKQVAIHVKIDTGMHRLGLLPEEAVKFIPTIREYKNVRLEGIFTHFATSDEADLTFAKEQLRIFTTCITTLKKQGIHPPLIHAANSATVLRMPEAHFSLVRPGIILYGLAPSEDFSLPFMPLPVMSFETMIVQLKHIEKGESVGYGRTFVATRPTLVGVLPVGYADGLRRSPHHFGEVLVRGKRVPLIGRISMDQTCIDLTDVPDVTVGDTVTLIGTQGKETITADDVAKKLGTINYEVVSSIAERVSRVYVHEDNVK